MEKKIYHRKRFRNPIQANNTTLEMKYLKESQVDDDGAQTPPLSRHVLPLHTHVTEEDLIEVGSVYEINHSRLPPRTPLQLRSIRLAMVSERTDLTVSVRFPSMSSLERYFGNRIGEMYPELDEKLVMGTKLAEKVLSRRVPSQEFAEKKHSEEFWLVSISSGSEDVVPENAGTCFSELKRNGLVSWGVRRQAKFIGRHRDNPQSILSFVGGGEKTKDEENEEEEETDEIEQSGKRKSYTFRFDRKAKKAKRENLKKNNCKTMVILKNPQDRWSTERYKAAEKNLLEVMRAKGSVYGNPILRPELRAEARKRIGDTGLLDHLLKHVAGKVAPGGNERFRRRHNAEGAMEYWLESADLADIRKEAGVQDPYWTPPPGWKPGDCPTQDPICADEIKQLKEKTSKIKRAMEEMVTKKQMEEELTNIRREMELLSKNQNEESQAIVVSDHSETTQKLEFDTSLVPLKPDLDNSLIVTLEKYKEQLVVISKYVKGIEETIGKLKAKVEKETRSDSALMVSTDCCAEKEKKQALVVVKQQQQVGTEGGVDQRKTNTTEKAGGGERTAEEKAAKIQRLKSGFRICKPQGTFLWPNMVRSNNSNSNTSSSSQVVVQVEDLLVVPTPPSVSSSTASAPPQLPYHHHQNLASPVKPLAERRAVTVTVSAIGDSNFSTTTTTTTTTTNKKATTLINLNDLPNSPEEGFCGTPSSSRQTVTTTTVMPRVQPSAVKGKMGSWEVVGGNSGGKVRETKGVETWLALATPIPALDNSNRG